MSWDKNTNKSDRIDNAIEILEDLNISYTVEVLGKVAARGQNDHYSDIAEYELRKLTYKDTVIIEQMIREDDCDIDDTIIAIKFRKETAPKDWELERNDNILEDEDILIGE